MKTADQILRELNIIVRSTAPGRYYTTCPQCSHARKGSHRKLKCLGVTITGDGVKIGCNHCPWTGGGYFDQHSGPDRGQAGPKSTRSVRYLYR